MYLRKNCTSIYQIPKASIKLIEHGVPDLEPVPNNEIVQSALFTDRKVLFTFGLISRNKGLETVIKALPEIVAQHPDVLYVILGNTHPGVVKHNGEEYRDSLKALAKDLGVENNIFFHAQILCQCFQTVAIFFAIMFYYTRMGIA